MNERLVLLFAVLSLFLAGCDTVQPHVAGQTVLPSQSLVDSAPAEKEPPPVSLFPADQAVLPDAVVAKILASAVQVYDQPKLAIIKFPDNGIQYFGPYYWRNEDYVKLQENQIDAIASALSTSEMGRIFPLPSLMTPHQMTIPLLREAAVRVQADLLLVYRIHSDVYSRSRAFAKDKVKAYSTCELVLLDIATGIAPFTKVVTRDRLAAQTPDDFDLSETRRRAEQEATSEALHVAAEDLAGYVKTIKRRAR
jgi:hypothetical protein